MSLPPLLPPSTTPETVQTNRTGQQESSKSSGTDTRTLVGRVSDKISEAGGLKNAVTGLFSASGTSGRAKRAQIEGALESTSKSPVADSSSMLLKPHTRIGIAGAIGLFFKDDETDPSIEEAKQISDAIMNPEIPQHQKLETLRQVTEKWIAPLLTKIRDEAQNPLAKKLARSESFNSNDGLTSLERLFHEKNAQISRWPDSIPSEDGSPVVMEGMKELKRSVVFSLATTIAEWDIDGKDAPFKYDELLQHDSSIGEQDRILTDLGSHINHLHQLYDPALLHNPPQRPALDAFHEKIKEHSPTFESIALQGLGRMIPLIGECDPETPFIAKTELRTITFDRILARSHELDTEYGEPIRMVLQGQIEHLPEGAREAHRNPPGYES